MALLQEVRGKRVLEGMARGGLGNPRAPDRILDHPLKDRLEKVVAAPLAGHAVHVEACGREDPLPSPGLAGVPVLARERPGSSTQPAPCRRSPPSCWRRSARAACSPASGCGPSI